MRHKKMGDRPDAPTMTGDGVFLEDDGGWEMLRICLPLDRIRESGTDDYMDFARLISIHVDVMEDGEGKACKDMSDGFDRMHPENPTYQDFEDAKKKQQQSHKSGFERFMGHFKKSSNSHNDVDSKSGHAEPTQTTKARDYGSPAASVQDDRVPQATSSTHSNQGESNTGNLGMHAAHSETKTGQGAFQGPTQDPKDLTSNASILPARAMKFRYGDHKEMRTAVNIKFGVLNERAAFADKLHETIQKAHDSGRRYKRNVDRPLAVFQVGQSDLLRLPEVEGGAGLPEQVLSNPPAPKRLPKRQKKEADLHGDDTDSDYSSSDSDSETEAGESLGNPGGVRTEKKQQNARIAKAIFGINATESVWMKRCYLNRTVPFRGHIILSDKYLCFWRKSAGPVPDIKVS